MRSSIKRRARHGPILLLLVSLTPLGPGALAAQERCPTIFQCFGFTSFSPVDGYSVRDTFERRLLNVTIGATTHAILAAIRGQDFGKSLLKSFAISATSETITALDTYLTVERGLYTPIGTLLGRITNSVQANVVHGLPLCTDVRTGYLLADLVYDCGRISFNGNATPLLGAAYFLVEGASLDLGRSLGIGIPTFQFSDGDFGSDVSGLALGGAIGYRERGVSEAVQIFDEDVGPLREQTAEQQALLSDLQEWREGHLNDFDRREAVTLSHEKRHHGQHDYLERLLGRTEAPWWVHHRAELLPGVRLDLMPSGLLLFGLVALRFERQDLPWEFVARVENAGFQEGPLPRILVQRHTDGTVTLTGRR